jgi:hypothetical protein
MKIDQINQYTSMIKHLDTELKTVISIVDRNYGIATSDKTKSKIASDPFKEIPKPEFLGIEVEKWHTILQTAALAAMIIPGLQGAGMALRGLSIIGAAETTLGGAIGFALSMVDAGIYINEENYMGAGIAFLFGMLGVKANWNILERGFHSLTDAVNVVMKEILMGSDAAGKEIVEMLAKKDDIIRKGITDYVNAVEKITNTSVEITEANLIKGTNLPWYTVSRVSEQGSTLVVRRAILEEYLYNVINISNRGINAALAGVSKDIPKFISGLVTFEGVIRGSEMLRDKLAPDADLCDLIENKLGRGDGACDLYKNVFGVETDEEKELLKKAILDFDWKPGMVIPKDYMTTESKKRLEESNRYQELLDIWGTTNNITKLEIPQETVKIVYEYVTETLPKEGTEEYNNIVNQESEETQKTILEKVKKQKELFDTDEEIDELIRQAQERVKKQKTPEKIEKSDFQNNEYFNDEIIDKYNFKKPSDLFN